MLLLYKTAQAKQMLLLYKTAQAKQTLLLYKTASKTLLPYKTVQ